MRPDALIAEFQATAEKLATIKVQLTTIAWHNTASVPCNCGGQMDGYHGQFCQRRNAAESLEHEYGVR